VAIIDLSANSSRSVMAINYPARSTINQPAR
jgi:hypothetical protein